MMIMTLWPLLPPPPLPTKHAKKDARVSSKQTWCKEHGRLFAAAHNISKEAHDYKNNFHNLIAPRTVTIITVLPSALDQWIVTQLGCSPGCSGGECVRARAHPRIERQPTIGFINTISAIFQYKNCLHALL